MSKFDSEDFETGREGEKGRFFDKLLPDTMKKVFMLGAGTIFMTEEAIRSMVGEMRFSKEVAEYLATQAEKSKTELFKMITREVSRNLERVDINDQLETIFEKFDINLEVKISFSPSEDNKKAETKKGAKAKKPQTRVRATAKKKS